MGLLEQLLQDRQRRIEDGTPLPDELTELEEADTQDETGAGAFQQPLLHQHPGEPVHGRLRYPRPRREFRERQLRLRVGEAAQQREDAFQHRLGSDATWCLTHGCCSLPSVPIRLRPGSAALPHHPSPSRHDSPHPADDENAKAAVHCVERRACHLFALTGQ